MDGKIKRKSRAADLIGAEFDMLTIVERRGTDDYGRAVWLAKCKCGGHRLITTGEFNGGRAHLNCGCVKKIKSYHGSRRKPYLES